MEVKIIAEMTSAERDQLLADYPPGFTIENIVFEMVGPYDDYQDIEVVITD
jgi:hypothetical protein